MTLVHTLAHVILKGTNLVMPFEALHCHFLFNSSTFKVTKRNKCKDIFDFWKLKRDCSWRKSSVWLWEACSNNTVTDALAYSNPPESPRITWLKTIWLSWGTLLCQKQTMQHIPSAGQMWKYDHIIPKQTSYKIKQTSSLNFSLNLWIRSEIY